MSLSYFFFTRSEIEARVKTKHLIEPLDQVMRMFTNDGNRVARF